MRNEYSGAWLAGVSPDLEMWESIGLPSAKKLNPMAFTDPRARSTIFVGNGPKVAGTIERSGTNAALPLPCKRQSRDCSGEPLGAEGRSVPV